MVLEKRWEPKIVLMAKSARQTAASKRGLRVFPWAMASHWPIEKRIQNLTRRKSFKIRSYCPLQPHRSSTCLLLAMLRHHLPMVLPITQAFFLPQVLPMCCFPSAWNPVFPHTSPPTVLDVADPYFPFHVPAAMQPSSERSFLDLRIYRTVTLCPVTRHYRSWPLYLSLV